jgi:hypothetical protein
MRLPQLLLQFVIKFAIATAVEKCFLDVNELERIRKTKCLDGDLTICARHFREFVQSKQPGWLTYFQVKRHCRYGIRAILLLVKSMGISIPNVR